MFIRAGYALSLATSAPTPLVAMLNIRPERLPDLRSAHGIITDRGLSMDHYHDAFSNFCTACHVASGA